MLFFFSTLSVSAFCFCTLYLPFFSSLWILFSHITSLSLLRLAVCFTSSVFYPESLAASMTCVSCAVQGCGTVATFLPWNVLVSIQTPRAAPMEAPLPPSPPCPPLPFPHPTPPPPCPLKVRGAPRPETSSPSASNLEGLRVDQRYNVMSPSGVAIMLFHN